MRSAYLAEYNVTVYEDGRVYSHASDRYLKHQQDRFGYFRIGVKRLSDGKRFGLFVHRALALAFIPRQEGKLFVNHINGNKSDFTLSNLEWCTHKENIIHASKIGRVKKRSLLYEVRNRAINDLIKLGWNNKDISEAFRFSRENVTHIRKHGNK